MRRSPGIRSLKAFRALAALSQVEAAYYLGISQTQLSRIENRKSSPSLRTLRRMAKLYGQSLDLLAAQIST